MLQFSVLPVTSTHRAMSEDRPINDRDEPPEHLRALARAPDRFGGAGFAVAAVALVCAALTGCTGEQFQKGYILPPPRVGADSNGPQADQVLIWCWCSRMPSTVATLNGEVFYYISQRSERKVAFINQQVVDQRVIAIYFG